MEDLIEFGLENLETYAHAAAGFALGAGITYASKLNHQRKGREMFPEPTDDWHESVLEDDPMYDEDMNSDNPVMEAYYDNFDTIARNSRLGGRAMVSTGIVDAFETLQFDENYVGFEDYPEMAAGMFAGIKAAEYAPTPYGTGDE